MIRTKLILVLLVSVAAAMGYEGERLPKGDWTVGFHLYRAEGFDSMPVRVTSVKSEGNKGLTGVGLRNRSSKPVIAAKLGWYVSAEGGPGTILAKGELPLLHPTLHANESMELSIPPLSLAKILMPVAKGNTLHGDFGVQVAVTEIVYADGSRWKFSAPSNVAQIKVQYAHAPQGCGQICRWIPAVGYVCESVAQNVRCIVFGESCIVESCDSGGN